MEKRSTSKPIDNNMRSNNTKTSRPDITRRHYSGAGEESRSQQRPNADLGSSSSTERKTTNTAGKDRLYPPSQQDKRISRGPSSSHHRSLHTGQPSWQQARRETSVTPSLERRFSGLNMGNRRSLRGGKEITYKFSGTITVEEPSEEQKPAETAAADTGTAES
jgi:hypothetical protein